MDPWSINPKTRKILNRILHSDGGAKLDSPSTDGTRKEFEGLSVIPSTNVVNDKGHENEQRTTVLGNHEEGEVVMINRNAKAQNNGHRKTQPRNEQSRMGNKRTKDNRRSVQRVMCNVHLARIDSGRVLDDCEEVDAKLSPRRDDGAQSVLGMSSMEMGLHRYSDQSSDEDRPASPIVNVQMPIRTDALSDLVKTLQVIDDDVEALNGNQANDKHDPSYGSKMYSPTESSRNLYVSATHPGYCADQHQDECHQGTGRQNSKSKAVRRVPAVSETTRTVGAAGDSHNKSKHKPKITKNITATRFKNTNINADTNYVTPFEVSSSQLGQKGTLQGRSKETIGRQLPPMRNRASLNNIARSQVILAYKNGMLRAQKRQVSAPTVTTRPKSSGRKWFHYDKDLHCQVPTRRVRPNVPTHLRSQAYMQDGQLCITINGSKAALARARNLPTTQGESDMDVKITIVKEKRPVYLPPLISFNPPTLDRSPVNRDVIVTRATELPTFDTRTDKTGYFDNRLVNRNSSILLEHPSAKFRRPSASFLSRQSSACSNVSSIIGGRQRLHKGCGREHVLQSRVPRRQGREPEDNQDTNTTSLPA